MARTIAILVSSLDGGGAEQHCLELMQLLTTAGLTVQLWVYNGYGSEIQLAQARKLAPHFLDCNGPHKIARWYEVKRLVLDFAPSTIIAINPDMNVFASALKFRGIFNGKIISIFHSTIVAFSKTPKFAMYRLSLMVTDGLVFVSSNQEKYWRKRGLYCARRTAIQNGIDLQKFKPDPDLRYRMRATLNIGSDCRVLSLLGGFRPEKNHLQLLRVFNQVKDRLQSWKLMFIGDGVMRPAIESEITNLGLNTKVILAGFQDDVRPYIQASDAGILCSKTEAFPLSAVEFLASGVPMLMSDVGGASEIVTNNDNGFLFRANDDRALAEALLKLDSSGSLERLQTRTQSSSLRFGLDRMAKSYLEFIETVHA
jgi:glycosyltransferase involved in cell wall biosynthesis